VVYTLDGAFPAHTVHIYCDSKSPCHTSRSILTAGYSECQTAYHNNYKVHRGIHYYYNDIPDFLQVLKHQFIER
jgi:hypothetical protein